MYRCALRARGFTYTSGLLSESSRKHDSKQAQRIPFKLNTVTSKKVTSS